jgi:hypothetical protein
MRHLDADDRHLDGDGRHLDAGRRAAALRFDHSKR